ncbi:uncharacterized protein [Canis lupus baileyi]|uniref:uncharacterized protein LOC102156858 isoform X14 n=2 Tax=Canis lupus familiaris TaxID=9615 RepID=UPI000BA9FE69|nr:uncharacterized protein LOC102156858 isoform X14 [Canis lupus familiaris]XP_025277223.1 uncharacterized protein LOC112643403 isoform X5 [Canis lupus dingo]|eukprot:XP_022283720.1 uncharacterized protein LOC102156858 isoform X1 [Canis lupus familiaris]
MSESKKGTAGGRDGKTTNNMTLPDKQPCLTPPFLLLPQTRSVLRVLSPEGQEYAAECLESISVLPVPQPHTGRPLPGETTVPAATATGGDSGTMNPSRHRHKSPGRMGLCRTPRSQRRTHTKCRGQRPALLRLETDGDAHPASHRDVRMYLGCRRGRGYFRARSDPHTSAMEEEETAVSTFRRERGNSCSPAGPVLTPESRRTTTRAVKKPQRGSVALSVCTLCCTTITTIHFQDSFHPANCAWQLMGRSNPPPTPF